MIFVHDTRDKPEKHKNVDDYLIKQGHSIVRTKMYVGDVTLLSDQSVCIDLKRNLQEICQNLCQDHERFKAEMKRAQDAGIKLIFVVEHGGAIKCLPDVRDWKNPRLMKSPYVLNGEGLYKRMVTIRERYGVDWIFCAKKQTGAVIASILGVSEGVATCQAQ